MGDDYVGTNNVGLRVIVRGNNDVYGIYSSIDQLSPTSGSNAYAGYFVGDVQVTGTVSASNGSPLTSDEMFKTNVYDLSNAIEKLVSLQPKTYYYDTIQFKDFNFEADEQMGLIAQEVEQILPTIVSNHKRPAEYDSLGNLLKPEISYKAIEYSEIIPLLVAGMQEQQTQIQSKDSIISDLKDELTDVNARLTQLENCLSALLPALCSMNQEAIQRNNDEQQKELEKSIQQLDNQELRSSLEVRLSDKNAIILSQNVPNPFAEMTTIKYSIPTTVKEAQIHFYTNKGIIINSVDIVERGNGEIRVFEEDLSSGLYTYSLVADGKVVATKKMVKN